MDRNHRRAGFLGKKNNALAGFIDGAARTIRCEQNIAAARERVDELTQGAYAFARAGAANRAVTGPLDENGDQVAVAARTDQTETLTGGKTRIKNARQHQQAVMPDGEDDRLIPHESHDVIGIFHLQTKGSRPEPIQPQAKHDQYAGAPAIELHFGSDCVASSFQR